MGKAYLFWQANRGREEEPFWAEFQAEFPVIYKFVRDYVQPENSNNGLAGKISYVGNCERPGRATVSGRTLFYAATVWHMANWRPFCDWIKNELEAQAVWWIGDGSDYCGQEREKLIAPPSIPERVNRGIL